MMRRSTCLSGSAASCVGGRPYARPSCRIRPRAYCAQTRVARANERSPSDTEATLLHALLLSSRSIALLVLTGFVAGQTACRPVFAQEVNTSSFPTSRCAQTYDAYSGAAVLAHRSLSWSQEQRPMLTSLAATQAWPVKTAVGSPSQLLMLHQQSQAQ